MFGLGSQTYRVRTCDARVANADPGGENCRGSRLSALVATFCEGGFVSATLWSMLKRIDFRVDLPQFSPNSPTLCSLLLSG